ncbi:MAG: heme biosynthesis HemY N-terminal domain-containing protein, partial [Maricaulaceae bacterium]
MVLASATAAFLVAQDPGQATFIIRGLEIQTSVAAIAGLIVLLSVAGYFLIWVFGLPNRLTRMRRRRRRDAGVDALELALLAAAGGDPRTARREARRAQILLERDAGPRLIAAQAAEQMGDVLGAETQFAAMLGDAR